MVQKSTPDPGGIDTLNAESAVTVHVHLVDARDWRTITCERARWSPISAHTYTQLGLPWFALADHDIPDLPVSPSSRRNQAGIIRLTRAWSVWPRGRSRDTFAPQMSNEHSEFVMLAS